MDSLGIIWLVDWSLLLSATIQIQSTQTLWTISMETKETIALKTFAGYPWGKTFDSTLYSNRKKKGVNKMISDSFVFINEYSENSSPLLAHYLRKAERRHLLSELDRELWFYK